MARSGLANLIQELRGMTEAGLTDYGIGAVYYWSDDHIQDILDIHRRDVIFEQLQMFPNQVASGSLSYKDYRSSFGFFEETTGGTAVFYVQDSTGVTIGTANYTPDYRRGTALFASDQRGSVYYLTGRSYDLQAAAADVWRRKASHYASQFDFSTDNHSVTRSQAYKHCLEMAEFYEGKSGDSIQTVTMFRGDM